MNKLSPWAAAASNLIADNDLPEIYVRKSGSFTFRVYIIYDSLWILVTWPKGGELLFRPAYAPHSEIEIDQKIESRQGVDLFLNTTIGKFTVKIEFINGPQPILRYTTSLKSYTDLSIPFWPRDMIVSGKNGNAANTTGKIHVSQVATRSGLIYMSMTRPKAGSVLYFQNLTALGDYCQQTETSCSNTVGGQWPELGFALPKTSEKPLPANKEVILSDAFVCFDPLVPQNEETMVKQYLNLLSAVYLQLPRPETKYHDWPDILNKGLNDLIKSHACWTHVDGHSYFNAYICDYKTPPEIMVQMAILLPLTDYIEWSDSQLDVVETIRNGLSKFYNSKIGSIMRWLPSAENKLDGEEEQKKPKVMDSWYLHHPLLNLSRLALKGDKLAKKLFLDSIEFAIKVAHHFNYQWPVFYNMETLDVVKEETQPGMGGEKDVPGIYAHIMLQAWEITGKIRYLHEAERSAKTLKGLGFGLFYQANNTAFSSGAMLRLWKITRNKLYLDLSYLCIANLFKNVQLWDCNYGYGKNFPSFFALFPLSDAPYTAVYEEQEVFCALHDYLEHAEGEDILPSVSLLVAEFIRFLVFRAVYYYPPVLPKEMLSEKVKIGELDPSMWVALEDMQDGWEKCGQVGQEVYGAGNAFGILPRHFMRIPDEEFMIYVDYPAAGFIYKKGKPVVFHIKGDKRLTCRMLLIPNDKKKLPAFIVLINGIKDETGKRTKDGYIEYILHGNQKINISWKNQTK